MPRRKRLPRVDSVSIAIDPCYQRDIADCGLASLAMVLGIGYERVSSEAIASGHKGLCSVHKRGVYMSDLIKLASRFDVELVRVNVERAEDGVCGILGLDHRKENAGHAVAVFRRVVFNPADGLAWDFDYYVSKWHARYLLIRADDEGQ